MTHTISRTPVMFSYHAAQRAQQRLNIQVPTRTEVDISKTFFHAKTYLHNETGRLVEAWASRDRTNPVVLIIAADDRVVLTVLTGTSTHMPPFVRECYSRS